MYHCNGPRDNLLICFLLCQSMCTPCQNPKRQSCNIFRLQTHWRSKKTSLDKKTYGQSCGRYVTPTRSIESGARSRRIHPSFVRLYPSRARFFSFGSRRKLNAKQQLGGEPLIDSVDTRSRWRMQPFLVMMIVQWFFIVCLFVQCPRAVWGGLFAWDNLRLQ